MDQAELTMKTVKNLNVDRVTAAIEADAGQALPGLRDALTEAKSGQVAQTHSPAQIAERRSRSVACTQAVRKAL
ncbi:hypothetical protein GCM10009108_22460 [Castellaniella ginsengisoli]|jgi:hypothetical protein|uniref:Uncharacterized protein n=2 Tax=Alcaligenaceae TaxID=506 RepID=A0ABN1L0R1_9BURK